MAGKNESGEVTTENTVGAKLEKAIDEVSCLTDAISQGVISVVSHKEMDLLVEDDYEEHLRLLVKVAEEWLKCIKPHGTLPIVWHRCRGRILPYPAFLCSMCPPGQEKVEFAPRAKIRELELERDVAREAIKRYADDYTSENARLLEEVQKLERELKELENNQTKEEK